MSQKRLKSVSILSSCVLNNVRFSTPWENEYVISEIIVTFKKKIRIHSMQDWTASTRNGVTRKRSTKRLKDTGYLLRKKPQSIGAC